MFMFAQKHIDRPMGAEGHRAYVVGDVHGRLDLLDALLAKIESDSAKHDKVLLVFVGDLVDRGPSSAQVIERLRTYERDGVRPIFILGNHEEVMLRILDGDASLIRSWLRFGGMQTLESYGVDPAGLAELPDTRAIAAIRKAIPAEHAEFLKSFVDSCRFGDYLFVHAGIRPGVDLSEQRQSDLRWIREPFLQDESAHGFVVVHGHTIRPEVEERPNRIGIDTGAFMSGVLTALAIEDGERWYLNSAIHAGTSVPATH